jgi:hypothetical protein
MEESKKGLRMYFFVPYNIMSIQKGIQSGHVAEQYALQCIEEVIGYGTGGKEVSPYWGNLDKWLEFVRNHKTWVILNGGTTNNSSLPERRGSLQKIWDKLMDENVFCARFFEEDLNDTLSAVCVLCDEKVWDWETYPVYSEWIKTEEGKKLELIHNCEEITREIYNEFVGGAKNAVLKDLIWKRPLAL